VYRPTDNVFYIGFLQFSSNDGTSSFSRQIFHLSIQLQAAKSLYRTVQFLGQPRNSPHLMEPKSSLPCSNESATDYCTDESSSHPSYSLRNTLILLSHLCVGLQSSLLTFGFPARILNTFHFCPKRATRSRIFYLRQQTRFIVTRLFRFQHFLPYPHTRYV
jgi:hypothetical protein